ncbi:hypothetical protein K6N86_000963 [Providencia rettgeri]|uniref:hypothetical protein n=1 Tax=Providencia sp. PROV270 TaxID=2949958 RepID=UPI001D56EA61|nr:hypothetical protein [Providencia sp. PROV270]EHZ6871295.1 hypothetical protein [Providencia rettgeri]
MTNNIILNNFSDIVKVQAITQEVNTESLFDRSYKEKKISPIDEFLSNVNKINVLWLNNSEISPEMANIVFLGFMSAVESYVRSLVRSLIQVDAASQKIASMKEITFGAALHHTKLMLPEALMDEFSFVHMDNIKETFKVLLGIKIGLNNNTEREFNNICQLRHCCVHRFGKLGAKNAMKLGIDKHNSLFEKPLKINNSNLDRIAQNIRSIVKQINNSTYKEIMNRTYPVPVNQKQRDEFERQGLSILWTKIYANDRSLFRQYYNIFSSQFDSIKSDPLKKSYDSFIANRLAEEALRP